MAAGLPHGEDFIDALELVEREAWADIAGAAPPTLAEAAGLETLRTEDALLFLCRNIVHNHFNWMQAGRTANAAEAVRDGLRRFREAASTDFLVTIPPSPYAPQCHAAAEQNGLRESVAWTKFARLTGEAPPQHTAIVVREAEDPQLFARTLVRGYGLPEEVIPWLSHLAGRPRWKTYLSYDGGTPIGGGTMFVDGPLAWFGIDATLPEGRRRGAQAALLARRIADARAAGAEIISGEAEVPPPGGHASSHANILRAGFEAAYERRNWMP